MMARADLLIDLIKYGMVGDTTNFKHAAEAISTEERAKQHTILADRIAILLNNQSNSTKKDYNPIPLIRNGNGDQSLYVEKVPRKRIDNLILPDVVVSACRELIEEQLRADLLRSYGLEPRNKLLLIGPPGNGKTSLAEAIAEALMLPLFIVRYESIVGTYLGETAGRLSKLMEQVRTRQCVLFFDEFETLGKERGDIHETGEIKRVVSSLLLHIDALPSWVVVVGATNHEQLLDKAAWRRFQLRLELPKPTRSNLELWFSQFEQRTGFNFGLEANTLAKKAYGHSYGEAEELALSIYRQYVLKQPEANSKLISLNAFRIWDAQKSANPNQKIKESDTECQKDH